MACHNLYSNHPKLSVLIFSVKPITVVSDKYSLFFSLSDSNCTLIAFFSDDAFRMVN